MRSTTQTANGAYIFRDIKSSYFVRTTTANRWDSAIYKKISLPVLRKKYDQQLFQLGFQLSISIHVLRKKYVRGAEAVQYRNLTNNQKVYIK